MNWTAELQNPLDTMATMFDVQPDKSGTSISEPQASDLTSGNAFSSLGDELIVPNFDFDMTETPQPPERSHNDMEFTSLAPSPQRIPPPGSRRPEPKRRLDSQCVLACCQIISSLEKYILAELKVLDIILDIVRRAVDDLDQFVRKQQGSRNLRCLTLFGTVMLQIIELLEIGCATFLAENRGQDSDDDDGDGTGGDGGNDSLSLSFGVFRVGPEQQRAWRSQVVLRELQQSSQILQKIITLAGIGPDAEERNTEDVKNCEGCYLDLERRLQDLCVKVGGVARHGA